MYNSDHFNFLLCVLFCLDLYNLHTERFYKNTKPQRSVIRSPHVVNQLPEGSRPVMVASNEVRSGAQVKSEWEASSPGAHVINAWCPDGTILGGGKNFGRWVLN